MRGSVPLPCPVDACCMGNQTGESGFVGGLLLPTWVLVFPLSGLRGEGRQVSSPALVLKIHQRGRSNSTSC